MVYLVFYHFYTEGSRFEVSLDVTTTPCPGFHVHCGRYQPGDRLARRDLQPYDNIDPDILHRYSFISSYQCKRFELKMSMLVMCVKLNNSAKQILLALLGHPKAECYSLQHYVPPYTSDNYSCILEIHPWPWQVVQTQVYDKPYRHSCNQSTLVEKNTLDNTVKTIKYSSECSLFTIDVSFVPGFTRITGQTLHSEFHFKQIHPTHLYQLFLQPLSVTPVKESYALMDTISDIWVMTGVDRDDRNLGFNNLKNCRKVYDSFEFPDLRQPKPQWVLKLNTILWRKPELSTATLVIFTLAEENNTCLLVTLNYVIIHTLYIERFTKEGFMREEKTCLDVFTTSIYRGEAHISARSNHSILLTEAYHLRFIFLQPLYGPHTCRIKITSMNVPLTDPVPKLQYPWRSVDSISSLFNRTMYQGMFNLSSTNTFYVTWHEIEMTWYEAENICHIVGGHLPTVTTQSDFAFIKRLILGERVVSGHNLKTFLPPTRLQPMTVVPIGKTLTKVSHSCIAKICFICFIYLLSQILDRIMFCSTHLILHPLFLQQ